MFCVMEKVTSEVAEFLFLAGPSALATSSEDHSDFLLPFACNRVCISEPELGFVLILDISDDNEVVLHC